MSYKKIILASGPKECGKGTLLQEYLSQYEYSRDTAVYDASCKVHLYKLVQDFFLVSKERFWEIYNDRELKEKPMPEFRITMPYMDLISIDKLFGPRFLNQMVEPGGQVYNLSIRQAMIYVSEIIIKPRLGFDYFGRARMEFIGELHGTHVST